ncbi:MAG TPA: hypothetical protein VHR45_05320 [Thermoanaerobaculia bacterium]|nr:hypothetical protein [Thermoanaerobaculia bacterium]
MNLDAAAAAARQGFLYPAVIVHGRDLEARREAALTIARTLLCAEAPELRPCGVCRHCRRIAWPGAAAETAEAPFHPDFRVLERDLKTSTSVDSVRELLKTAQFSPFEARGQVFVIASAETLTGEAANALLKSLEEPHTTAPRHFLLLAPSRLDLLPTLRSRSLAIFLGSAVPVDPAAVEAVARPFAAALDAYAASGAAIHLLSAAGALSAAGGWEDPRAMRPWVLAAAVVLRTLGAGSPQGVSAGGGQNGTASAPPADSGRRPPAPTPASARPARLAFAEALLTAPAMRLRGITAERILEGLVARHLA